jgi:hypothetical protein
MFRKTKTSMLVAAAALLTLGGVASASPLVNLSIQGSIDNGASWANSLQVTPGENILIRVVGSLASTTTQNSQGGGRTINSEVSGTDGIGSLKFDVLDSTGTASSLALQSPWSAGTGASAGAVTAPDNITGIRPILASGVADVIGPSTLETASLKVGTLPETLTGQWSAGGSGAFKINGGTNVFISSTTEANADPLVSYAPLTLTTAPEPASLLLAGVGGAALLMRRRKLA